MPRERGDIDTLFERLFFAVLLAILVFAPLATGAVRAVDFLVVQGATVVLLLLWTARVWFSPGTRLLWPPVAWVAVAFCGYAVACYFTADIEYIARQEVIRVLVYGAVFLAALNNVTRRETVQWLGIALVALAAGISVFAVYQWAFCSNRIWNLVRPDLYAGRGSGTFICPNHLAGFLEMLLPLGLAYSIAGRGGFLPRLLLGYLSLMLAGGLLVSQSRAGWAAAGAGLALFFLLQIRHPRYRWPALALALLVTAAAVAAAARTDVIKKRVEDNLFVHEYGSGTIRAQIWRTAFAMWREHPLAGVGPAHFDPRFPQYRPATVSVQSRPDRAHNDYLNTLADWGLIGFALVAAAWALVLLTVARVWKYIQRPMGDLSRNNRSGSPGQSNRTAFVTGAVAGLAALLLHALFDFNMHIPANALLAVTLLALLAGHIRFATERWWCSGVTTRLAVTLSALVLGVALGATGLRRAVETKWLRQAERAEPQRSERFEALKRAAAAEPMNAETAYEIGEQLRVESWAGGDEYAERAAAAVTWFERAASLNPHDASPRLRLGMCWVWVGQPDKAAPFFDRAGELDPHGYYTLALRGWHRFHAGKLDQAKMLLQRSLDLTPWGAPNPIAHSYLALMERRAKEPPSLLDRRGN
jgi:O-antigen ligase/Tfp pilus assembly protein PilF